MKSIQEHFNAIEKRFAEKENEHKKVVEKVYDFLEKTKEVGFNHNVNDFTLEYYHGCIPILVSDKKDFSKIHKIVGPLVNSGMGVNDDDKNNILARIYLKPKNSDWNFFTFYYDKPLPPDGKCKIVVNNHTYHSVVCER